MKEYRKVLSPFRPCDDIHIMHSERWEKGNDVAKNNNYENKKTRIEYVQLREIYSGFGDV